MFELARLGRRLFPLLIPLFWQPVAAQVSPQVLATAQRLEKNLTRFAQLHNQVIAPAYRRYLDSAETWTRLKQRQLWVVDVGDDGFADRQLSDVYRRLRRDCLETRKSLRELLHLFERIERDTERLVELEPWP